MWSLVFCIEVFNKIQDIYQKQQSLNHATFYVALYILSIVLSLTLSSLNNADDYSKQAESATEDLNDEDFDKGWRSLSVS